MGDSSTVPMYRIVIIGTKRSGKRTLLSAYADNTASKELPRFGSDIPENKVHADTDGNVNIDDNQIIRKRRIGAREVLLTLSVARLSNDRHTNVVAEYQWLGQCDAIVVLFDAFATNKVNILSDLMRSASTARNSALERQHASSVVLYTIIANKSDQCAAGSAELRVAQVLPHIKTATRYAVSAKDEPARVVSIIDELLAAVVAKRAIIPAPSAALISNHQATRSPLPSGDSGTPEDRRKEAQLGVANYGSTSGGALSMSESVVVIRAEMPSVIISGEPEQQQQQPPPPPKRRLKLDTEDEDEEEKEQQRQQHEKDMWNESPAFDLCTSSPGDTCTLV